MGTSGNEPGLPTENSKDTETGEQEKINPSHDDQVYDEVDANVMSSISQGENKVTLAGSHSFSTEQEKDSEAPAEGESGTNSGVPKIEIIEGSTTSSDSSSDEDSDSGEERRKKKLRKKRKSEEDRTEDDDVDELKTEVERLTKDNETMKERIENLSKEKTSLEESLEDQRSKMQV